MNVRHLFCKPQQHRELLPNKRMVDALDIFRQEGKRPLLRSNVSVGVLLVQLGELAFNLVDVDAALDAGLLKRSPTTAARVDIVSHQNRRSEEHTSELQT